MTNKHFLFLLFLFAAATSLPAVELSGTYNKDFTVKTEFNTVSKGKTLRVTDGATFIMTDAIVSGSIIVEKGSSFIAAKDGQGYMVLGEGSHVEGIDLYYKVRVSEELVFTRKFPMTLDQVWKSGNQELIGWVRGIEYCYSYALKGWVSMNEIRNMNPFNENLYEDYDMVFTQSLSKKLEIECRSLIVKNKAKVLVLPNKDVWSTRINKSLIVEKGSSLIATENDGHKLQVKPGLKIEGLPLYVRFNNDYIAANSLLSDLWKLPIYSERDYVTIFYKPDLEGWAFEDPLYEDTIPDSLKKKLKALKTE